MSRSIDQAPQDHQDNPKDDSQPAVHPERVDMRSPGNTSPAYPDHQPDPLDTRPNHKNRNRLLALAAAIGVTGLTIIGIKVNQANNAIDDLKKEMTGGGTTNSAEPFPETNVNPNPGRIETQAPVPLDIYNTDISEKDYTRQLDIIAPIMEQERNASIQSFNEGELYDPNLFTGEKKIAQTKMNELSYNLRTVVRQTNTTLSKNLLAGVYAIDSPTYETAHNQIGKGLKPLTLRYQVDTTSNHFTSGTIDLGERKIYIDSDTQLINAVDMDSSSAWNVYVSQHESQDGKYQVPVIVALVEYGHPGFVQGGTDVENWQPGPKF